MASTYSTNLKIELIGTGEQAGTWGTTTNTNLGTALEQAVVGKADVTMSSTTITLTLTNANTAQDARAIYLNLTGSPGGAAVLEVPAIQKPYIVKNGSDQQVTIKVSGLTGVPIPTGKTALVYNNGTDVVTAVDHIPSLTLGAALPVASGGTGITSFGTGVATFLGTPSSANLAAAVTDETGTGDLVFATSPTLVTPALGTPSSGTLTNATGLPLSTGVTGLLPVANGGTATATPSLVAGSNVTVSGTWPNQTIAASNPGGTVTSVSGTGTVQGLSLSGTVTSSGNLTLGGTLSAVNLTSQVTGTLPVANGGTGITSFGTGVATALGQNVTGSGGIALATSPTFVTPVLGTPTSGTLSGCTVDGTDAVGFRNIPQNSQSAAYTLVLADAGKHIFHPSGDANARTFTIPANSSVAYAIGTAITFINMTSQVVTIAITTDTMYLSSAGTTGSRSLAQYGSATAIKMTSTTWLISGSGLT
jgi:hypothetical protein